MVARKETQVQVYRPGKQLVELFRSNKRKLMGAIIKGMDPDRFIRSAWIQITEHPELADCSPASIMSALIKCGQQGLYPDGVNGHAYLVGFRQKDKKTGKYLSQKVCTYIRGYKGLIALFGAHPKAADLPVVCEIVYEGDVFDWGLGSKPFVDHVPQFETENPIRVYAAFRFRSGDCFPKVMTWEKAMTYKRYAKTDKFWKEHPEAMVKKTCIKQGAKFIPLADTIASAIAMDDALEAGDDEKAGQVLAAIASEEGLLPDEGELGLQEPKALPRGRKKNNGERCQQCKKMFPPDKLLDGNCSACLDQGNGR